MTLSIRLSSFSDFTAVNVEGLGVIKVKKESSNQGARQQEIIRDIFKLQDSSKRLGKKIEALEAAGKTEDDAEYQKLNNKALEALESVTELQKEALALRKSRLEDDEDGKLVELLFANASDEDITKLLDIEKEEEKENGEDS